MPRKMLHLIFSILILFSPLSFGENKITLSKIIKDNNNSYQNEVVKIIGRDVAKIKDPSSNTGKALLSVIDEKEIYGYMYEKYIYHYAEEYNENDLVKIKTFSESNLSKKLVENSKNGRFSSNFYSNLTSTEREYLTSHTQYLKSMDETKKSKSAFSKASLDLNTRIYSLLKEKLGKDPLLLGNMKSECPEFYDRMALMLMSASCNIGSDNNCTECDFVLAQMNRRGDGVPVNLPKSLLYYERSAINGHSGSALMLGMLKINTGKTAPTKINGTQWLMYSSELGNEAANSNLESFKRSLPKEIISEASKSYTTFKNTIKSRKIINFEEGGVVTFD